MDSKPVCVFRDDKFNSPLIVMLQKDDTYAATSFTPAKSLYQSFDKVFFLVVYFCLFICLH